MFRNFFNLLLSLHFLIFNSPVYPSDFSAKVIENYTLKISRKFSNTYCNSTKFGISKDGSLRFSIGETNKEFSNNKLNKYIDYELLSKNILLNLENNCKIFDFPEYELENLEFK
tara:strand:- start:1294 stop:1635 length:342 start_codon:yes stop_codon:yes gene_type:complete